ncbi:hypothetical protein N7414_19660, partial [Pseudomonas sp. GD04087]|uniref:hypothetical protein n=1 Tax=unclassified Pseudomonas TaxID=196821 RepID=UPI00244B56E1
LLKSSWLRLSSQPRRAFYANLIFRQALFFENFFSTQSLGLPRSQTSHQREAHSTAIKLTVKHLGDLLFSSLPEQLMKSDK